MKEEAQVQTGMGGNLDSMFNAALDSVEAMVKAGVSINEPMKVWGGILVQTEEGGPFRINHVLRGAQWAQHWLTVNRNELDDKYLFWKVVWFLVPSDLPAPS